MKGNTIKTVLLAGVCLMLLCSCANNSVVQEPATETEIKSAETADVTVTGTETEAAAETEAVTETEKTEEEVDATEELPSTEEKKTIDAETKYEDWKTAYSDIVHTLAEGGSLLGSAIDTTYSEIVGSEWEPAFFLQDLNHDDIPELFLAIDSGGNIKIYTFDTETGQIKDTGVNCGYATSGSVRVRALKGTDCFVTGPAFANETVLYRIQNGETEQLLGFGNGMGYHFYTDDYENEISEEEFRNLFKEYTGIAWNADFRAELPDDLGLSAYLSEDGADKEKYEPLEKIDEAIGE